MVFCSSVRGLQACKAGSYVARTAQGTHAKVFARIQQRNVSSKAADWDLEEAICFPSFMQDLDVPCGVKAMEELMQRPDMPAYIRRDFYEVLRYLSRGRQTFVHLPQIQRRMQAVCNRPEFRSIFAETYGDDMEAFMKHLEAQEEMQAYRCGGSDNVQHYLDMGQDANARDKDSRTPLHYAARSGRDEQEDVLSVLFNLGAELDAKDNKGNTPLHYAVRFAQARMVEDLMESAPDAKIAVTAKNNDGQTPYELVIPNSPLDRKLRVTGKLRYGVIDGWYDD